MMFIFSGRLFVDLFFGGAGAKRKTAIVRTVRKKKKGCFGSHLQQSRSGIGVWVCRRFGEEGGRGQVFYKELHMLAAHLFIRGSSFLP